MEAILRDIEVNPRVDLRSAVIELKGFRERLRQIALESVQPEIIINASETAVKLKVVDGMLDKIDRRRVRAKIDVDTDNANRGVLGFITNFDKAGSSLRAFNGRLLAGVILIPLLIPLVIALAGAVGALSAALVVGALGFGVLIAAFSGIGDAVKALGDVQKNGAKDALAAAKAIRVAAKGVREAEQDVARAREDAAEASEGAAERVVDAQRSLGDAQDQAARAAEGAAQRVADAQQGIADAQRNAARQAEQAAEQVADALERQEDAQDDLTDANRDALRAQERLTEARKDAQDQIEDLAISVAGGALAERQAVIDLFEAEVAFRNARADTGATNLEREQALINLEQQRLRLIQVRTENARLAEEQVRSNKLGVEGSDAVVAAQDGIVAANGRVASAQEGVQEAAGGVRDALQSQAESAADNARSVGDAQRGLADAMQAQRQTSIDSARSIADAQRGVSEAIEAQGRTSRDNAQSLADAQQKLADAQENYQETLIKTREIGSASMAALEQAMGKLGPAGQAFAVFLATQVLPFLKEIRGVIQEAMLPGVTSFLQTLLQYGPQISAILGAMAKAIGDFLAQAATEVANSPAWQDFFTFLLQSGPGLFTLLLNLGLKVLTVFLQMVTAFGPLLEQVLMWLVEVTEAFSNWLQTPQGQKELREFLDYIVKIAPLVGAFFGALVMAAVSLGKALAPYAEDLLRIFTGVLNFIAGMDPKILGAIVLAILGLVFAIQFVLGLASLISTIGIAFTAGVLPIVGIIAGVILILFALGFAFILLWRNSETFRDIVKGAIEVVGNIFSWLWENVLRPVINFIIGYVTKLWEIWGAVFDLIGGIFRAFIGGISAAWDAFANSGMGKAIIEFFDKYVKPAWAGFADWARGFWGDIQDIFKVGVRFIVDTVLNDGLIAGFNFLARAYKTTEITPIKLPASFYMSSDGPAPGSLGKIGLPGHSAGGWTGPGEKYQEAGIVHADEFVVRKESQRKMRDRFPGLLDYINREGSLPGYAEGGVVAFGRFLQGRGFRVGEHPLFGGVAPVHKGRGHYEGRAIDVNFGPGGKSAEEKRAIDSIVGLARGYGLSSIWQSAGHFGHAHFEQGAAFKDIIGRVGDAAAAGGAALLGGLKDAAGVVVGAPLDYLLGKVRGLYGSFKDSAIGGILIGGVEHAVRGAADFIGKAASSAFDTQDTSVPVAAGGPVIDVIRNAAASRGWGQGGEWAALSRLIQKESSFNPTAQNPTSTAYGLFQFLNSTWAGTGFKKSSDPAIQTAAGLRYIADRYGTPSKALAFHNANNYYAEGGLVAGADNGPVLYDSGGWLQPGVTQVVNASGKPEPIFSASQWDSIAKGGMDSAGGEDHWHLHGSDVTPEDFADAVLFKKRVAKRGGVYAGVR
ncbi:MAG: transglycosylase SLT domain-containing protein [Chloroflexota bacterium]|nr:transglycosylase SLT domain-containing protein [Chloroflexota bacterium]